MRLIPTEIAGCRRVQLELFEDDRGYFTRVFDLAELRRVDPSFQVAHMNRSFTRARGAIRGVHFQRPPRAEDKLVQCLAGRIFDVCVDNRPDSRTYRRWVGFELSPENMELLWIPNGCGHAFQTLTGDCLVEYLVSQAYAPELEGGIRWDDPAIGIAWPLPCTQTSEKDARWPLLTP